MTHDEFSALGTGMDWSIYENDDDTTIDLSAPEGVPDGEYMITHEYLDNLGMSETLAEVRNGKFEPVTTGRACYQAVRRSYRTTFEEVEDREYVHHCFIEDFTLINNDTLMVGCGS